jgi:hypothetical protein
MFMGKGSTSKSNMNVSLGKGLSICPLVITHSAVALMTGLDWKLVASHESGTSGLVSEFGMGVRGVGRLWKTFLREERIEERLDVDGDTLSNTCGAISIVERQEGRVETLPS